MSEAGHGRPCPALTAFGADWIPRLLVLLGLCQAFALMVLFPDGNLNTFYVSDTSPIDSPLRMLRVKRQSQTDPWRTRADRKFQRTRNLTQSHDTLATLSRLSLFSSIIPEFGESRVVIEVSGSFLAFGWQCVCFPAISRLLSHSAWPGCLSSPRCPLRYAHATGAPPASHYKYHIESLQRRTVRYRCLHLPPAVRLGSAACLESRTYEALEMRYGELELSGILSWGQPAATCRLSGGL